jgi:hypothetical protein
MDQTRQARKRLRERRDASLQLGIIFVDDRDRPRLPLDGIIASSQFRINPGLVVSVLMSGCAAARSANAPPALSPSVLGSKDTTPRVRQIGCCTAESRPPPPGLWQRWGHKPAYLSPRRAGGMSAMPA